MRNPTAILNDLLHFKRDALEFFQTKELYETGEASFDLGLRRVRVICAAPLAQAVLTSDCFERGQQPYGPLGTFAGQGSLRWLIGPSLPVLDDHEGIRRRRIIRPVHVNTVRGLRLCPLKVNAWPLLPPGDHDLYSLVTQMVFDLLCEALFGRTYPEEREHIAQTINEATDALDLLSKSLQPYACSFGKQARVLRRSRQQLASFAKRVIDDLENAPATLQPPMKALLGGALSQEELIDEVVTHIIAGLETTTITCCWCVVQLLRHPDYIRQIRQAEDETQAQDLTRYCVLETMRQYPAFWTLIRVAKTSCTLMDVRFDAKDVLFVSPLLIHHHPDYWPQASRFRPERHLDRQRVHPADYMPFGFGARSCIGAQLSSAIASNVVRGFVDSPQCLALGVDDIDAPRIDPKIIVLKSREGFTLRVGNTPSSETAR